MRVGDVLESEVDSLPPGIIWCVTDGRDKSVGWLM